VAGTAPDLSHLVSTQMGVRPGQIQPAACDLRVGDDRYLDEMTQLSEQFAELAEALRPVAGETDTMIVPVSLLRRLTNFVERGLPELREVACYIPNEVLEGVSRPAIPPRAETYDPRFFFLESHAARPNIGFTMLTKRSTSCAS
jgi:hypothetical protein